MKGSPQDIVIKVTADCEKENCAIHIGPTGVTAEQVGTLYDRKGDIIPPPPPVSVTSLNCQTCGATWRIHSRGDDEDAVKKL